MKLMKAMVCLECDEVFDSDFDDLDIKETLKKDVEELFKKARRCRKCGSRETAFLKGLLIPELERAEHDLELIKTIIDSRWRKLTALHTAMRRAEYQRENK